MSLGSDVYPPNPPPEPPRPWATALLYSGGLVGGGLGIGAAILLSVSGVVRFTRGGTVSYLALGGAFVGALVGATLAGIVDFVRESARGDPSVLRCPHCRRKVRLPGEFAGLGVKCPLYGARFTAPSPPSAEGPGEGGPRRWGA
jgi:hypothetical protein